MRKKLVAGNWKMNTDSKSGVELAKAVATAAGNGHDKVDVLICPPFVYLMTIAQAISGSAVKLGAQNCYFEKPGAFTGETAVPMIKDVGAGYVILGHSERRHVLHETDELINRKMIAVLEGGLIPVFCVGELLSEREGNKTEAVLDTQLKQGLAGISESQLGQVVIAYEPVWAIGTGKTASPEQAEEAHAYIRSWLAKHYSQAAADKMQILYGGSVKSDNAKELMAKPNVDGALVGGASLKAADFVGIIDAAKSL